MPVPRLPLEQIVIPVPCAVPWDAMTGDDRVRVCGQCRKAVYQIKNYTRDEAEELLGSLGGDACVHLYRRPDGTVLTADCAPRPDGLRGLLQGAVAFAGAGVALLATGVMGTNANSTFSFVGGSIRPTDGTRPVSTSHLPPAPASPAPPAPPAPRGASDGARGLR